MAIDSKQLQREKGSVLDFASIQDQLSRSQVRSQELTPWWIRLAVRFGMDLILFLSASRRFNLVLFLFAVPYLILSACIGVHRRQKWFLILSAFICVHLRLRLTPSSAAHTAFAPSTMRGVCR
jgi:hypothetical protein